MKLLIKILKSIAIIVVLLFICPFVWPVIFLKRYFKDKNSVSRIIDDFKEGLHDGYDDVWGHKDNYERD